MFGVASTGDVIILLMRVLCLYHCTVCTVLVPLVQCSGMTSTGRVSIYPRLHSYCTYTVAQCVLCLYPLYRDSAWPAREMYILLVFVLVLCVYPLYSGLAWPARAVYLLARVCTRTVVVPLHSVYYACTSCTVVWHGQHG